MIIVSLVVFVPFISSVNAVEIFRLSRSVLVMPPVYLHPHSFIKLKKDAQLDFQFHFKYDFFLGEGGVGREGREGGGKVTKGKIDKMKYL